MKYNVKNGYYFGFLNTSIKEVFDKSPWFFNNMDSVVTCLDSNLVQNFSKEVVSNKFQAIKFGNNFLIKDEDLSYYMNDKSLFCGFDEVFIFNKKSKYIDFKASVYTTDGYNFLKEIPDDFSDLFFKIGSTRYLSDGCGLNFVCESYKVLCKFFKENR